jgi:hypothetical protein
MNIAPSPVLTVRGTVCRQAVLASSGNGVRSRGLIFRWPRTSSRIRSNTTTESLTE